MSDDTNRWQKLREILREHFDIMQPFSIDYQPTAAFLRLESAILALMQKQRDDYDQLAMELAEWKRLPYDERMKKLSAEIVEMRDELAKKLGKT